MSALCRKYGLRGTAGSPCKAESALVERLSKATDSLYENCEKLRTDLKSVPERGEAAVTYYHDVIVSDMQALRADADLLEQLTDKSFWPYPTYSDLLFY